MQLWEHCSCYFNVIMFIFPLINKIHIFCFGSFTGGRIYDRIWLRNSKKLERSKCCDLAGFTACSFYPYDFS